MSAILLASDFLDKYHKENLLLLDTRSEKEYDHAHIPGALNLPLLNNENRHLIGIEYKTKGREAAVAMGFKLVGPHFYEFIDEVKKLTDKKEIMLYCWRGGMRSGIMSWVLSMAGFNIAVLKGGYKSFRNLMLAQFSVQKKIIIVGGHTGSGKTEILNELKNLGEQVIDLEALANHRGSAFGNIGLKPQNSNEHFENDIGMLWRNMDDNKILWIEGESHSIGRNKIPDDVFNQLNTAPLIEVLCSREYRKDRIIKEYCVFPREELADCTKKLKKRLGGLRLTDAINALEQDNLSDWLEILLDYYDKTYAYSTDERKASARIQVAVADEEGTMEVARRLLTMKSKIYEKTKT